MSDDEEVIPSGMLLVFLCLVLLVGLMIILKTCCHCDRGQLVADPSPSTAATNTTSVSVINPSVAANGQENHGFIDIELEPPPSYEEAIKLPRPNNNP